LIVIIAAAVVGGDAKESSAKESDRRWMQWRESEGSRIKPEMD